LQDIEPYISPPGLLATSIFQHKEWRYSEMFENKRRVLGRVGPVDVDFVRHAVLVDQLHTDAGRRIVDNLRDNAFYRKRGGGGGANRRDFQTERRVVAAQFTVERFSLGKIQVADKLGIDADDSTK